MIRADRLAHASRWRGVSLTEKSLACLGLLTLAMALPPWPGGALVLAVASAAAMASGVRGRDWARLLAPPGAFILTGALTLPFTVGAQGWGLSADGAMLAAHLMLRAFAAVSAMLLLSVTTPVADILHGLRRLGLPEDLAETAITTYRFIFILQDTMTAMQASQAARLGGQGWKNRIRSAGLLAAALFPRALDQARRLEVGLAARGYDGSLRTLHAVRPVRPERVLFIMAGLCVLAGIGIWL